ncbi:MAG: SDR family NAD(P)-dependent oxidoreductase [Allosphingosinicella sp.]|uniref:SDR family NAD(P)-dependent oxidoreductase n=1 Tax=Allosphingosinicella sp. TaxID=2823234 RepID=UPI0039394035
MTVQGSNPGEMKRLAVVTAAAHGIGRAVALGLAREGHPLLLVDREADALDETAEAARSLGTSADVAVIDCTDPAQVDAALGGREDVAILVNAVGGSARERSCAFTDSAPDLWETVHQVSLGSAMLCARAVLPAMQRRSYGRIVNVASDAALRPTSKMAEYAAAKAGVIGFTRALATEFAPYRITANAVAPGLTATRALEAIPRETLKGALADVPVGRVGTPEEVAHAVLFLASERAGYITGQTVAVNGGRSYL